MAISYIHYNSSLPHGTLLRSSLTQLENGHGGLGDIIAVMQRMIDGDGSQVAHFEEVMSRFGFPSTTIAKSAWDELNSLQFKLNTNASVSDVHAAMLQVFSKFRL